MMFTSNLTEQMRVIHNLNLLLVEEGLGIYLRYADSPPSLVHSNG